jgi:hypothetical protein
MALRLTEPLTEMSARHLPGGKGQPACKADNLTAICEPAVWTMWEPQCITFRWASMACYRDSFTFYLFILCDNAALYKLPQKQQMLTLPLMKGN